MPYTPILTATADMMAETWLGAPAWAEGSQMCRGNMPALTPKPRSASQKSGARSGRSRRGPRSQVPTPAARAEKNANRAIVPAWDAAR